MESARGSVRLVLLTTVTALTLLWRSPAPACSCGPGETPQEALAESTVVLTGRVVALSLDADEEILEAVIKVRQGWKGVSGPYMKIHTHWKCCLCGYPVELGKEYLLYAAEVDDGRLFTGSCTRNARLESAGTDLAALGPGTAPAPGPKPDEAALRERVEAIRRARTSTEGLEAFEKLPGRKAFYVSRAARGCELWGYSYGYVTDDRATARAKKECESNRVLYGDGPCTLVAQGDAVPAARPSRPRCDAE